MAEVEQEHPEQEHVHGLNLRHDVLAVAYRETLILRRADELVRVTLPESPSWDPLAHAGSVTFSIDRLASEDGFSSLVAAVGDLGWLDTDPPSKSIAPLKTMTALIHETRSAGRVGRGYIAVTANEALVVPLQHPTSGPSELFASSSRGSTGSGFAATPPCTTSVGTRSAFGETYRHSLHSPSS